MINCNLSYKNTTLIGKKLLLIPNILMAERRMAPSLKQPDVSTHHEQIRQILTENFQTNVKVQFPLLVVHFIPLWRDQPMLYIIYILTSIPTINKLCALTTSFPKHITHISVNTPFFLSCNLNPSVMSSWTKITTCFTW